MPRKKPEPKPLLAVKFDFVQSLDAFINECLMFYQAVDLAVKHGELKPVTAEMLGKRAEAFRKALFGEDGSAEA